MSDLQVLILGLVIIYAIKRGLRFWIQTPWGGGGAEPPPCPGPAGKARSFPTRE
jgi:hypothetical protein